jgi:hypothetical protein
MVQSEIVHAEVGTSRVELANLVVLSRGYEDACTIVTGSEYGIVNEPIIRTELDYPPFGRSATCPK